MFDWDPGALYGDGTAIVAGVGCAIWGETVSDFDDVVFLVLPRLAGLAHKAWSLPLPADWERHRDALAAHGRLLGTGRSDVFSVFTGCVEALWLKTIG